MTGTTEDMFHFPVLSKIIGEPIFDILKDTKRKLDNNAGSVPTTLGGGTHGYLTLTNPGNTYFTLTGANLNPTNDPRLLPHIPPNATGA